jgi:uncharacterized membrane protein YedE/YeeE
LIQDRFYKICFYFTGTFFTGIIQFGFGWALTGACPGPLFAQIGYGFTIIVITFLFALSGTWFYAYLEDKLP